MTSAKSPMLERVSWLLGEISSEGVFHLHWYEPDHVAPPEVHAADADRIVEPVGPSLDLLEDLGLLWSKAIREWCFVLLSISIADVVESLYGRDVSGVIWRVRIDRTYTIIHFLRHVLAQQSLAGGFGNVICHGVGYLV